MQKEIAHGVNSEIAAATLSCIGDGVISTDLSGKIIYMNQIAEEIMGWDLDEAIGLSFEKAFVIVNAETNGPLNGIIQDVLKSGVTRGLEQNSVIITGNQIQKYISATCSPVKTASGSTLGAVVVFRDITRLRTLEIAHLKEESNLKKSRDRCINLLDHLPSLIWQTDDRMNLDYVNRSWIEFTGTNFEKSSGQGLLDVIHPEDLDEFVKVQTEAARQQIPFSMEMRVRRADGDYLWFLNIGNPYFNLDHQFSGYIGTVYDINERKKADSKIFESQAKYRSLLMNMHNGYAYTHVLYDEDKIANDLKFIEVNAAFEEMVNSKENHIIGKSYTELFPNDKETLVNMMQKYGGKLYRGESISISEFCSISSKKWYSLSIYSPGENCVVIIMSDITHIKETEIGLKGAKEAAEAVNKAKSEFLANMSHEIRTPINGMVGMVDLTLLTQLNDDQKDNLITAKACANSLLNIINDILDFSKIEAGKMVIENVNFNIKGLIEEVAKTHSPRAAEKGLDFNYTFSSSIPRYLIGDPNRLRQVLNNLISNAMKFTENGGIDIIVKKNSEVNNEVELRFSVTDTGIGIASENIDCLFKSFSQLDGSFTKKFGGTGLGLAISKQLVEMMGGKIGVESEKSKGSIFFFLLKFKIGSGSGIKSGCEIAENTRQLPQITKALKPLNILVAEDDPNNQKVIIKMLKEKGHRVDTANNGKEAFSQFDQGKYDVVLMDIQMPEMNGIEAAKRIREKEDINHHTPIIATTAYVLRGDKEMILASGMDGYISKPIRMEILFSEIERLTSLNEKWKNSMPRRVLIASNGEVVFTDKRLYPLKEKVTPLLSDIAEYIKEIDSVKGSNDLEAIEKMAHNIKILSSEIDADEIKDAAFKLELAARRGNPEDADKYFEMINNEFERYKASII